MSTGTIVKEKKEYKRNNLTPKEHYVNQAAFYIAKMANLDIEEAKRRVREEIAKDENVRVPQIIHYERGENGDREETVTSVDKYVSSIGSRNELMAPTFTTYKPKEKEESFISKLIAVNLVKRGKVKKEGFAAKNKGDMAQYNYLDNKQTAIKLTNNSFSGAFGCKGSVVSNKSGHSTLTSTTRTVTSTANGIMERLTSGNRHYATYPITQANILSIVDSLRTDNTYNEWATIINKYNIHMPTTAECMEVITRCTKHYWMDRECDAKLIQLLDSLDGVERSAFAYTGDLRTLMVYNQELVRGLIDALITKVSPTDPLPGSIDDLPDDVLNATHHIFLDELRGLGTRYASMDKDLVSKLHATGLNIINIIDQYKDLLSAIMANPNLPPNVAETRNMIRYSVVASDTDSTINSLQSWVEWYCGKLIIDPVSTAVTGILTLFSSQALEHGLRQLSRNLGIGDADLDGIAMKSEFTMPVFAIVNITKTYFASLEVVEGNVLTDMDIIIKGVHLKNSNTPMSIRMLAKSMMLDILGRLRDNKKLQITKYLKEVEEVETIIMDSLKLGKVEYLRGNRIKETDAYKNTDPTKNPSQWATFWNDTFGDHYGYKVTPPYRAIKVPTTMDNKTKFNTWIDNIKDTELKGKIQAWRERSGKTQLPTIYIPEEYGVTHNIPKELMSIMDAHSVVLDLVKMMYLVLESLNVYIKDGLTLTQQMGE